MHCRQCDCNPCMCGKKEYPSSTCRNCDHKPCMCGKPDHSTDREHQERQQSIWDKNEYLGPDHSEWP
jgi:hypothetical protein